MKNAHHIDTYLSQASNLRFKLWTIVGQNRSKFDRISAYLEERGFVSVDVGESLSFILADLESSTEPSVILPEFWTTGLVNLKSTYIRPSYEWKTQKIQC